MAWAGKSVGVEGIETSKADVLLRISLADGATLRRVLTPNQPELVVTSAAGRRFAVAQGYTALGINHILGGWDHLLFVLGLVLLVGWGRLLCWTVSSFTAGHSVTLALASLGLVHVPQKPIEAAIALSIYWLAVELARSRAGEPTLMLRAPWIAAAAFGLLHGLGFAAALAEVGLPAGEIPLALLAFNAGIELGQIAFVAVTLLAIAALRTLPLRWPRWTTALPGYSIGSLATCWLLERLWSLGT